MDDTTPTDPAISPEEAMREKAAQIAERPFLPCDIGGDLMLEIYTAQTIAAAIRRIPLSTPVVAHQGAESDRQSFVVGFDLGGADETAVCIRQGNTIIHTATGAEAEGILATLSPTPGAETPGQPVRLNYTNWRGETAERTILPLRIWYGATDWHPEPQWLLTAMDVEKGAERDFALKDFGQLPAETPGPYENDAVWAAYYRDGKSLGEIADMFGLGVYDLAPWLREPMERAILNDAVLQSPKKTDAAAIDFEKSIRAAALREAADTVLRNAWKYRAKAIHDAILALIPQPTP